MTKRTRKRRSLTAGDESTGAFERARQALHDGRVVVLAAGEAEEPEDQEARELAHDPRLAPAVELVEIPGTTAPATVVLVPPGHLAGQDLDPTVAHRFEELLEHVDPYCRLVAGCCLSHDEPDDA